MTNDDDDVHAGAGEQDHGATAEVKSGRCWKRGMACP